MNRGESLTTCLGNSASHQLSGSHHLSFALPSIMIVDIWQWTPFVVLVLLAGLQSIPREVVEAAALDGLKSWQYFTRILWPLLRPVALIVLLIRTMDAIKVFDTVYVLTRGGPGTATYVASMYNYVLFFGNYQVGYAAAMSYIILIIVNVFAIALIFALSERRVREEESAEEVDIAQVAAADPSTGCYLDLRRAHNAARRNAFVGEVDWERRRHHHRVDLALPGLLDRRDITQEDRRYRQSGAKIPLLRPDAG